MMIHANSIKLFNSLSAGRALGEVSRAYALLGPAVDTPLHSNYSCFTDPGGHILIVYK